MTNAQLKVVEIRPHTAPQRLGKGFGYRIEYVLEDGSTHVGVKTRSRLKDCKADYALLPRTVDNMTAVFHDGRFAGVEERFEIVSRGGRMVLAPRTNG